jgi:molybdenum cofactor cytidylyltransferase
VAGVVLAAGLSRRMGARNKLLIEVDGTPMVRRVVESAVAAGLEPMTVVVGHGAPDVRRALDGLPISFVENERPETGLSRSLRVALRALPGDVVAAVVLLADMPWVERGHITALIGAFDPNAGREICVPVHAGRRGNPVLWSSRYFDQMAEVKGDVGARALLDVHAARVHEVPVAGTGVLRDIDTPEALAAATALGAD